MDIVARVRTGTRAILVRMATEGAWPDDSDLMRVSVRPAVTPGRGDLVIDAGRLRGTGGLATDRVALSRLAEALAATPEVGAAEVAGPGSVDVTLSLDGLTASLADCLKQGGDFGRGAPTDPVAVALAPARRPGLAGPSLGRARAAAVADALSRLLALAGRIVLLPPDADDPAASADFGRIGVGTRCDARLPDDWPGGDPAILVHEAEQGVAHLTRAAAAADRVAVAPCRLSTPGASGGRRDAALGDALALAEGAALRFAMLARMPGQALNLDPRRAADASHANPFFDIRYAHARARGVLRRAATAMPDLDLAPAALARVPLLCLSDPGERAILRSIALYPDRIASAAASRDPSRVAVFLAELARAVHGQWKTSKDQPQLRFVNEEQRDLTKARLGLVTAAALVLHSGLAVLGVSAPEEMR